MTRIVLVRHGSTFWNKEKRAQGHSNNPLDDEGVTQAIAVAKRLSNETWDTMYCSDLLRAQQTADIIAERIGLASITYDSRLREMYGGVIEGTTIEERIHKWGEDWREIDLGIEKPEDGSIRGTQCIFTIEGLHRNKNILVISHGAIIRNTLKGLIPELSVEQLLNNTSVTEIIKEREEWKCKLYNCTKHLNED